MLDGHGVDTLLWTVLCLLLGWHLRLGRHVLPGLTPDVNVPCASSQVTKNDSETLNAWVQKQMDEMRAYIAYKALEFVLLVQPFFLIVILTLSATPLRTRLITFTLTSVVYIVMLVCKAVDCRRLARWKIIVLYVVGCGAMSLRFFLHEEGSFFYTCLGTRAFLRFAQGLVVLDWRISALMNAFATFANIYHHLYMQPLGHPDMIQSELVCYLIMQLLLWSAECCMLFCTRLNLSTTLATNVQQAVRSLLSVLCDAEVYLTSNLQIQDPSGKVCQMLAPCSDSSEVQGKSFVDFVSPLDRDRFRNFLVPANAPSGPPTSISLLLRDSRGTTFPVEVFQATLPGLWRGDENGGHLFGLRDCRNDSEACFSTVACGNPPSVQADMRRQMLCPCQDDNLSCSSATECALGMPQIQRCEIKFLPLHDRMPIQELLWTFDNADSLKDGCKPPAGQQLRSCFPSDLKSAACDVDISSIADEDIVCTLCFKQFKLPGEAQTQDRERGQKGTSKGGSHLGPIDENEWSAGM